MEAKRMGEGEAMPPPPPPPPLAATSSMTEVTSTLTTSSIQALEATEKKIIRLMEVAAQATAALSTMDATIENKRQVIASLNDYFALVQEVHNELKSHVTTLQAPLPYDNMSYPAKKDFEIARMQTEVIHSQLLSLRRFLRTSSSSSSSSSSAPPFV
ncbi:hypothetical protein QOT17_022974 [Balamuthia mandrillaris]